MRTKSLLALTTIATATLASQAHAHINATLGDADGRNGDQKSYPCDGPKGPAMTYEPGATIEINVDEQVPHPSYFRVSFDDDGQDFVEPRSIEPIDSSRQCPWKDHDLDQCGSSDFCNNDAVLIDNLAPHLAGESNKYSWKIKLPDVECDNCTLQVIQVMEDAYVTTPLGDVSIHGAYCPWDIDKCNNEQGKVQDIYHRCFDITLKKGAKNGPGGSADDEVLPADKKFVDCRVMGAGDAGVPPVRTADAGTDGDSSGDASTGGATGSKQDAGTKKDASATATKDGSVATDDGDEPAASKSDDSGCALAASPEGAAWSLLALGLLVAQRRRFRRA